MKAVLALEAIGYNYEAMLRGGGKFPGSARLLGAGFGVDRRYYVAEVQRRDDGDGTWLRYLRPKIDYTKSNGTGSRGVYAHYILESDRLYKVKELLSWNRSRKYFCIVSDLGDIFELTDEDVEEWLSHH